MNSVNLQCLFMIFFFPPQRFTLLKDVEFRLHIHIWSTTLCAKNFFPQQKKKKIAVNEWSRSSPSFLPLLNQILGLRLKTAFCSSSQTVRLKMWVSDYWWHNEKELLSFMRAKCFVAKDCLNASSKDKCMQEEKGL